MIPSQIQRVLACIDLPSEGEPLLVLSAAARVSAALGAELHVVHAAESGPMDPPLSASTSVDIETARAALDAYLYDALPDGTSTASRTVELGRAHRVIRATAEALGVDLLMMGPHRGGNLQAQFLGTTTDRVLRTMDRPCWVVRAEVALPLRRLTVAVDFSAVSARALDLALVLARSLGAAGDASTGAEPPALDVIHVAWTVSLDDDPELEERELLPALREEIAAAKKRTGLEEVATVRPQVLAGVDPARAVLSHAEQTQPDLIILGTHGRGAVARALVGDVASIVTRRAPTNVVLVPPEPGTDGL